MRRILGMAAITGALCAAPMAAQLGPQYGPQHGPQFGPQFGPTLATANADTVNWDAIAQCESGGDWSANSGNGAYGGLQFKQATWDANGGVGSPAYASRDEQIRVAENVMRTQGLAAWPKCGSAGGAPAVWSAPTSGCQFIPTGIFGIARRLCGAMLNPLGI